MHWQTALPALTVHSSHAQPSSTARPVTVSYSFGNTTPYPRQQTRLSSYPTQNPSSSSQPSGAMFLQSPAQETSPRDTHPTPSYLSEQPSSSGKTRHVSPLASALPVPLASFGEFAEPDAVIRSPATMSSPTTIDIRATSPDADSVRVSLISPFDRVLTALLRNRLFSVDYVRKASYAQMFNSVRDAFTTSQTRDRHVLWKVLMDQHCMLLLQHLDSLDQQLKTFDEWKDLCADLPLEQFELYFNSTVINLDTLLSNVYYAAGRIEENQGKHALEVNKKTAEFQLSVPRYHHRPRHDFAHAPAPARIDPVRPLASPSGSQAAQRGGELEQPLLPPVHRRAYSAEGRYESEQAADELKDQAPSPDWVIITSAQVAGMNAEIRRQREYTLLSDGNYSYEVWDHLSDDAYKAIDGEFGFRAGLQVMATEAALGRRDRPDHVGEYTLPASRLYTLLKWVLIIYWFGEISLVPLLIVIIRPHDLFEGLDNKIVDIIGLVLIGLWFVIGGLKLWSKRQANRNSLTMVRRKRFLLKCMFMALLIRVLMIMDELVKVPPVLRLQAPRSSAPKGPRDAFEYKEDEDHLWLSRAMSESIAYPPAPSSTSRTDSPGILPSAA